VSAFGDRPEILAHANVRLGADCTIARYTPTQKDHITLIDRLREEIQQRLDQLTSEADRLRKALAALDPRSSKPPARTAPARRPARSTAAKLRAPSTPKRTPARRTSPAAARTAARTAPGATKASVLAALADGATMTAGDVATKSGLPRATVSTTLSRLAKSGDIEKAERGYRLRPATSSSPAA
jgi:CRP-like cAMP-binding protein